MEKNQKQKKYWQMKMSKDDDTSAEIYIYGDIVSYQWDDSDTSASSFKAELDDLGDISNLDIFINSSGGSVFEGVAIYNILKRHKARVVAHIDALAASISSVIPMAADEIRMPKNSMMMIHNPWTFAMGNAVEMRKVADDLDRIGGAAFQSYLQKAGDKLPEEKLKEMLDAETWLSADEAFEYGLCDVVEEANQMAASISNEFIEKYRNAPKKYTEEKQKSVSAEETALRNKIAEDAKAGAQYINTILGGI